MCRLIAYLGKTTILEEVLIKPDNSLLAQSLHARESSMPTNGDGFGLAWYTKHNYNAGLFTSTFPAWHNRNLKHLAKHISSKCFFAHVRAASSGGITEYNCHPFIYNKFTFMHNGGIGGFLKIKRHLRNLLSDNIYNSIKGETDSEHIFALFLQNLIKYGDTPSLLQIKKTLLFTVEQIIQLCSKYDSAKEVSNFNLCVTNGSEIVATRITTGLLANSRTLHYISVMNNVDQHVIIASEKLNQDNKNWREIMPNNIILINSKHEVNIEPY